MSNNFISLIDVNLTSQEMYIIWNDKKKEGPFHIYHGKGKKGLNCKIEKNSFLIMNLKKYSKLI